MKMTLRMKAIEEQLDALTRQNNGHWTPEMKALMAEYQEELKKVKLEDVHWEFFGNDDDLGCSYCCPACGFQTPEESFWSSDFQTFKPYTECTQCGIKLKA